MATRETPETPAPDLIAAGSRERERDELLLAIRHANERFYEANVAFHKARQEAVKTHNEEMNLLRARCAAIGHIWHHEKLACICTICGDVVITYE